MTAVFAAYGRPEEVGDGEVLERLVTLSRGEREDAINKQRTAEKADSWVLLPERRGRSCSDGST